MTADDLLTILEARGVILTTKDGRLRYDAPAGALSEADLAGLRQYKADILAALRGRALGVDWTRVSLWQFDRVLELAVPWADAPLILAPGCRVAKAIRESDPRPAYVWCVCEVLDLLLTGVGPEDARKIAEAKQMFSGTIGIARRLNP